MRRAEAVLFVKGRVRIRKMVWEFEPYLTGYLKLAWLGRMGSYPLRSLVQWITINRISRQLTTKRAD